MTTDIEYYDLGNYHRPVTTTQADAQRWFDRGLIWSYAFNHEEAVECFEKAIILDPKCAMAYWGLAYCLGPNYNKPWESFDEKDLQSTLQRTAQAVTQAETHVLSSSAVEKALIRALRFRYPKDWTTNRCEIWDQEYADAMKSVYDQFSEDLDVATLYADALMNLTPWQMWDLRTGEPAKGARTLESKAVLNLALDQADGLEHPGLLHLYIHLMEMSGMPEEAVPIANHLRGLVPNAGHLNHMPTHLDILCGNYEQAVIWNTAAVRADDEFYSQGSHVKFYTLYRCHNYHFLIYAAMFAGQSTIALDTVAALESSISEELLQVRSPPMADWLEGFLGVRVHVLIRFGLWQDIIALKLPSDQNLYCVTTAMTHYAKGVALAASSNVAEAERERHLFHEALQRVPSSRTLFNNKCIDILGVASTLLDGELEYRKGNFDVAFKQLRRSITLDDSLPYDEPWGWMQPTRHAYGALLLEQGHVKEAAAVYKADLGLDDTLPRASQHRNNVWALHGYHECLMKLGQVDDARSIKNQLDAVLERADLPIRSSCFCRINVGNIENTG